MRPWDLSASQLQAVEAAPPDQQPLLTDQFEQFNRSTYFVPFLVGYLLSIHLLRLSNFGGSLLTADYLMIGSYIILGVFGAVMLAAFVWRVSCWVLRPILMRHTTSNSLKRLYLNQLLEAPLFKTRRAEPLQLIKRTVVVRYPGRLHSLAIFLLFFVNFLTLFAYQSHVENPLDAFVEATGSASRQYAKNLLLRSACLLVAQLPLLFALAGRNSPVALITGATFNTLMLYHRWFARVITLHAIVHAAAWTHMKLESKGSSGITLAFRNKEYAQWGLVGVLFFALICFMATVPIRRFSYEFFLVGHIIMVAITIVAIWRHVKLLGTSPTADFFWYLYAAVALWASERLLRTLRVILMNVGYCGLANLVNKPWYHRMTTHAVCRAMPDGTVHVRLYLAGFAARNLIRIQAGQHVYLNLPSVEPFSMHPFSVISTGCDSANTRVLDDYPSAARSSSGHQPYIDLTMFAQSGFTRKLAKKVHATAPKHLSTPAFVEGPYGNPIESDGYGSVILVAGGIGVTHCLACLIHCIRTGLPALRGQDKEKSSADEGQNIHLIWCIRNPQSFALVAPYVRAALEEVASTATDSSLVSRLVIRVFITNSWNPDSESIFQHPPNSYVPDIGLMPYKSGLQQGRSVLADSESSLIQIESRMVNQKTRTTTLTSTRTSITESGVIGTITGGNEVLKRDLSIIQSHASLEFIVGRRPFLPHEITAALDGTQGRTFITSCGSSRFADMVRQAVREVRTETHRAIDFHDESFSW